MKPVNSVDAALNGKRTSGDPRAPIFLFERFEYATANDNPFIDITEDIGSSVSRAGVEKGFAMIYSEHTTAAIRINESEPFLHRDFATFFEQLAPKTGSYLHNDIETRRQVNARIAPDEHPNGHSHCLHLLLSTHEYVPIYKNELQLGEWQRIFLVELDRPRVRRVSVLIIGL